MRVRAVGGLFIFASTLSTLWALRTQAPSALSIGHAPVAADAIFVLSGDPDFERTQAAIELYRRGFAPLIVFSGAGHVGDSAIEMASFASKHGVPPTAVRMELFARSTEENFRLTTPLLRSLGVRRVLLVSSRYHLLRATLVARRAVPEIEFTPVAARQILVAPGDEFRGVIREYGKLCFYALRGRI